MTFATDQLLPFDAAVEAIEVANATGTAVLGIELFRILAAGLATEDYSGYNFDSQQQDWPTYASLNNDAALAWITQRQRGDGFGYILTSMDVGQRVKP